MVKVFAVVLALAAAATAQDVFADGGETESNGPAAVNHKNENSGTQVTNSLMDTGNKGGNSFKDLTGNTFSSNASNEGTSDSNIINSSNTKVSGNTGNTANGNHNRIGDDDGEKRRRRRRDVDSRLRNGQYF
ncbi:hypothetical protein H4R19_005375 [Coemansia spiralis]|nr:hypothetical protein H4R19_005375 [Coemansia spiralis]